MNIAICHYQQFAVPNFPYWYFLCDPDIKMQKLCSVQVYKRNEYIVDKKRYWRRKNYHFKGLYKTTCYKTKSNFSQFCYSHWLLHEGFFSFLIKAFVKSENLIRFHHQAFIISKHREKLKIQVVAWGFSLKISCEIFDKIRTKSNKKEWTEILLRDIFRNIFLENS